MKELPRPIPRNSVESDHGCTSRIIFDNAGDNVTLALYNVTLTSHKQSSRPEFYANDHFYLKFYAANIIFPCIYLVEYPTKL